MNKKIAIIGAGNMGQAIASSLLDKKVVIPKNLILTNINLVSLQGYKNKGVNVSSNNREAVKNADIIILAVKPQILRGVLTEIKNDIKTDQLILSIAAGVSIRTIESVILGRSEATIPESFRIIRVMPNLAATVGASVSGWVKNSRVSTLDVQATREILQAIGQDFELSSELQIDNLTVISGCGPGYLYYITEILENEAKKLGFSQKLVSKLVRQTIIGSAKLLENSQKSARELRVAVSSKGGMTEAAINSFEDNNFKEIFKDGIKAALKRAKELKGGDIK